MGVLAACGLLVLLAAAPVSASPDRRLEGLWEMTSWSQIRSGKDPEKTHRRRERRCVATQSTYYTSNVFNAAIGKSYGQRVTIDRDRVVLEETRVWDRSRRFDFPWMSLDLGPPAMWMSRTEITGDPERRIKRLGQAYGRDVVAGTASKDIKTIVDYAEDHRRLGDCPSDFRFMSLRELWRSIFQWWL
jgi:hypothetical protein